MRKAILYTGLLAGTLDAFGAIVNYALSAGKDPLVIFKFIASGVFGMNAFNGGVMMIMYGFIFHYLIAICWTAIYFFLIPRINAPFNGRIVSGVLYGIIVWAFMNLAVVPMSNTPSMTMTIAKTVVGMFIIIACIGLPISILASRHYSKNKTN